MQRTRRAGTLITLILACHACDNSTGPSAELVGTFVLQSVDGGSVPDSVEDLAGFKYDFVAETLTVAPDRSVRVATWIVDNGAPGKLAMVGTAFVAGDSVFITNEELGVDLAAGVLLPNGIELRPGWLSVFWTGRVLRYRRAEDA